MAASCAIDGYGAMPVDLEDQRAPLRKLRVSASAASSLIFGVGWHVLTNGKGVAGGRTTLATPFGKPQDVPHENQDLTDH